MGPKVHYNLLSTFSRRVLIAFAERQLPRSPQRGYYAPREVFSTPVQLAFVS